jgi:hypothetical protein
LIMSNFIWVEKSHGGAYMSIRTKQDTMNAQLFIQLYTKNKKYYTFFFKYVDDDKTAFFAVRKTISEVDNMGVDNNIALIQEIDSQKIQLFVNNPFDGETEQEKLKSYTKTITFKDFLEEMKQPQEYFLHLTFERCMDNRTEIDFLPIIYQEKSNIASHRMLMYDVIKQRVTRHTHL